MMKFNYTAPQIETLEVETEQGIAISNEGFARQAAMYDLYIDDEE
jgi:hypothetical protein